MTVKISPLIVHQDFRSGHGVGSALLRKAEDFSKEQGYRQLYCTVAQQNSLASRFFVTHGFTVTGNSDSHYKSGITELMLVKPIISPDYEARFDREHISVLPYEATYADQVRHLLIATLPKTFLGIDHEWVNGLFRGYERRDTRDVNAKFKLIYLALDRAEQVRGVIGATPKKGSPIKLMPFIATELPSFVALLKDVPFFMREYGSKLYVHITPSPDETIALQQSGWHLNSAMPAAYHPEVVTQQWSLNIDEDKTMRSMRVKDRFLRDIESGRKNLEVRVGYPSINSIKPGELIDFSSRSRTVQATIQDVRRYKSFEDLLAAEEAGRIVPGETRESLLKLLREIYPPFKEKLGVVVLQVAVQ